MEIEKEAITLSENTEEINIEVVEPKSEMRRTRGSSNVSMNMPTPPPLPVMLPPPTLPPHSTLKLADFQAHPSPILKTSHPLMPEGTNIAKKYIAKGDAISDEEEKIEDYIAQRRQKREKMLSDIERRRRMKLAERKASMARKWSEAEDGEDLASILREEGHGLTVYEEPKSPNTGKLWE